MKSALLLILFTLFLIDVSGADVKVSVMVGDSVILHSGNKVQAKDVIMWYLNRTDIAMIDEGSSTILTSDEELKARLQLDSQTGDLNITNIKTTDSGDYELDISRVGESLKRKFSVSVVLADVSANAVKSVIVMEGDSVTLKTDIQTYDVIQWRSEHQNFPVDRLQQGSLIIKNITTNHSGLYEAEISSTTSGYTTHRTQSFNVTVRAHVKSLSVMEGDSVTLRTGLTDPIQIQWKFGEKDILIADLKGTVNKTWGNADLNRKTGDLEIRTLLKDQNGDYKLEIITRRIILHSKYHIIIGEMKSVSVKEGETFTLQTDIQIQKNDEILWMFRDTVLAEMFEAGQRFKLYDDRFKDRLKPDHQTGSLIITNTTTTDFGRYNVKISSSRYTINKRFIVAVKGSDDRKGSDPDSGSGLSPGAATGIAFAVILGAAVLLLLFYNRKKIFNRTEHRSENGQNHKKQDTDDPNEKATFANNPETENSSSL